MKINLSYGEVLQILSSLEGDSQIWKSIHDESESGVTRRLANDRIIRIETIQTKIHRAWDIFEPSVQVLDESK